MVFESIGYSGVMQLILLKVTKTDFCAFARTKRARSVSVYSK